MLKRRNIDILDYNYRSDYNQVIYLQEQKENLLRECLSHNLDNLSSLQTKYLNFHIEINGKLGLMNNKLHLLSNVAIRVFQRAENV